MILPTSAPAILPTIAPAGPNTEPTAWPATERTRAAIGIPVGLRCIAASALYLSRRERSDRMATCDPGEGFRSIERPHTPPLSSARPRPPTPDTHARAR